MDSFAEEVYYTLQGESLVPVPGVENAFEDGKPCMQWYQDMMDAYDRLRYRLGVYEEDADVEIMIDALLRIQKKLCLTMFAYGRRFAAK